MTSPDNAKIDTPLKTRLIDMIALKGPITVADYMTDALSHPNDGYYMSQPAIGADGDFTTAPEISQVFGELIGLWLVDTWRAMGSPDDFNLIELGPGRGVLMEDILRAARLRRGFIDAADLWLVESSGRLRIEQQRRLRASEVKPKWLDDFEMASPAPSLIIANEFFDCFPVRQFERTKAGWRERLVGNDAATNELIFVLDTTPPPKALGLPEPTDVEIGAIYETSFAAQAYMKSLCERLRNDNGALLLIDYGHMHSGLGETLQAVRNHQFTSVLSAPGKADITAHVDFEQLSTIAIDNGLAVYGPVAQGEFLERLGLNIRVEMLAKSKSPEQAKAIRDGAYRIAAPNQMGEIFKVMVVTSPDLSAPAGFFDE